jgi:hypothetical protein
VTGSVYVGALYVVGIPRALKIVSRGTRNRGVFRSTTKVPVLTLGYLTTKVVVVVAVNPSLLAVVLA